MIGLGKQDGKAAAKGQKMPSKAADMDKERVERALLRLELATDKARQAAQQVERAARKAEQAAHRLQKRLGWQRRDDTRRKIVLGSQMLWMREAGNDEVITFTQAMIERLRQSMRDDEKALLDQVLADSEAVDRAYLTQCKAALGGCLIAVARQDDNADLVQTHDGSRPWAELARTMAYGAIRTLHRTHDIRLFRNWEITAHG